MGDNFYQGGKKAIETKEFKESKIKIVINCAVEVDIPKYGTQRRLGIWKYHSFDLKDNDSEYIFPEAHNIYLVIKDCIDKKIPVFLHCAKGMNRSCAIAVYVCCKLYDMSVDDSHKHVCSKNPNASIDKHFLSQITKKLSS